MGFSVQVSTFLVNRRIVIFLILIIVLIHVYPFLSGYRLSADDVAYHWYAMKGFTESWQFIKYSAIAQGRIVHFLDLVTSLIGAYFADFLLFRVLYVALYFTNFFLFILYFSRLLNFKCVWFFLLILFVFHPLDYFHMSPGAYPFKISFPVFIILISRIQIIQIRRMWCLSPNKELPWVALCFLGMMFSEYSFSFALSLIVVEFLMRTASLKAAEKKSWFASLTINVACRQTLHDFFIIFLFLILYISFRIVYPSSYEGNVLPSDLNIFLALKTMAGHILGGSIFSSFGRHNDFILNVGLEFNWLEYLLTITLFLATFISSAVLLCDYCGDIRLSLHQGSLKFALFCIIIAIIVTAPVALTTKYQSWCGRFSHCVFLDSCLSYLGFGCFLASILFIFILKLAKSKRVVYIFSFLLAFTAAAAQINNFRMSASMSDYVSGWDRARLLSSYSDEHLSFFHDISRVIEPIPRISFHPGFDILNYWRLYIGEQRSRGASSAASQGSTKLFPDFSAGKMYFSNFGEGAKYLTSGWSRTERWGVWSDGDRAEIVLPLKSSNRQVSIKVNAYVHMLRHPFQRVCVAVNGVEIDNIVLSNPTDNLIKIDLAEVFSKFQQLPPFTVIQFMFKDAVSPFSLGLSKDKRMLSIGLVSLEVS